MKISIISFTQRGRQLSERIAGILKSGTEKGGGKLEISLYTKCKASREEGDGSVSFVETSVGTWAGQQMKEKKGLLFVGACGIAVRAIAPFLTDKLKDGPVLVMDEKGRYIIPILSGHVGGANELAGYIAEQTGAEPVITTATDIHQKFAVDVFAKKNGFFIENKDGIAKVSAKVLAGKKITMSIEPNHRASRKEKRLEAAGRVDRGSLPEEIQILSYPPVEETDIVITSEKKNFDTKLLLRPREYAIGVGCKRGKSAEELGHFIEKKIKELGIEISQIFALASISQKKDEAGLIEWCKGEGIAFLTYTAEELEGVEGDFQTSAFVKAQVGVDNVCERAALKVCEEGCLIASKYAENGMTIAVARREWRVCFYDE